MYRVECVLFLCTVHISDTQRCDFSSSNRLPYTFAKGIVLLSLLHCDCTVVKTVSIPVETCNRSSFRYECDRYEILVFRLIVLLRIE